MSDKMFPLSIPFLLNWIGSEYEKSNSIFQFPVARISDLKDINPLEIFGTQCAMPVGPAAGPHTQLSQNIITAYLAGGRFFELKTVQKRDSLEFAKPCIDARDECYNTEWSTELSLEDAFSEYAKAWVVLHLLNRVLFKKDATDFIFNMSIGYDLAGIKTAKMQTFIDGMMETGRHPSWQEIIREVSDFFQRSDIPSFWLPLKEDITVFLDHIPTRISNSVTLSTMHGCPPSEIRDIASYLLKEKKLHTFVKLNPTLLGYETVKGLLAQNGFDYLQLDEAAFKKDLQFADAIPMLAYLQDSANKLNLQFGVKLSNTLAVLNKDEMLPGDEKYMSGRSLFPLTIHLADKINHAFKVQLKISYSGGAGAENITSIIESGILPVTVATDLLKPGGYLRLADMVNRVSVLNNLSHKKVNSEKLQKIVAGSVEEPVYKKQSQMPLREYPATPLGAFDCYKAPCVSACPIHQDIPQYIELAGRGEYEKALEVIYNKNPLPNITGYICDHQCEYHCTRNDYEEALAIRSIKRIAAEKGKAWKERTATQRVETTDKKIAVIGAGPAGLAAAYFASRSGFSVTVFEREEDAGGITRHVLPDFRISADALQEDIDFIEKQGVTFKFSVSPQDIRVDKLLKNGFDYLFIAIGASRAKQLEIGNAGNKTMDALQFLRQFKKDPVFMRPGQDVIIVGGGNTAMDSARAAKRLPGVENVAIVYRRSLHELPADREEFEMALDDGVRFLPLLNPLRFDNENTLVLEKMGLGEADASGRARPVSTGQMKTLKADFVITAIGESVDTDFLSRENINLNETYDVQSRTDRVFIGGDARRGPATVVEAIADARAFVEAICRKEGTLPAEKKEVDSALRPSLDELKNRRGFKKEIDDDPAAFAEKEALRCLHCDHLCNKCVEVCPNRANFAVTSPIGFANPFQIVHLDDLCNECGNCATFCPHDGQPYRDKLTLFSSKERFMDSNNPGFYLHSVDNINPEGQLRWKEVLYNIRLSAGNIEFINPHMKMSEQNDHDRVLRLMNELVKGYSWVISDCKV